MNRISGKMLLLIELSILLVFFCFSSAVCAYLFVAADKKSSHGDMLSQAVVETTSIAETLKSCDGDLAKAGELLSSNGKYYTEDNYLALYYDGNFEPVGKGQGVFRAEIDKEKAGVCNSYKIIISHDEKGYIKHGSDHDGHKETIYDLSFKSVEAGGGISETP